MSPRAASGDALGAARAVGPPFIGHVGADASPGL